MFKRLRRLSLLRPLEARSYRLLWAGEGLSLLADQVFIVALTLLVSRITGTGVELGAVLAVASVPGALLMPLGGVLSDRFSPAGVMVCASVGRAVLLATVAGLVLTDAVALWHLYVIGGALSAFDALYYPASLSIVRDRGSSYAAAHGPFRCDQPCGAQVRLTGIYMAVRELRGHVGSWRGPLWR